MSKEYPVVSIVAPMYNEGSNVQYFYERVSAVLQRLHLDYEIICVNDGSKDDTWNRLKQLSSGHPNQSNRLVSKLWKRVGNDSWD